MQLLGRLLRLIITGLGALVLRILLHLLAIILPLIFRLLSLIFGLMIFSLVSIFVGLRTSVERTAEIWTDQFMNIGIPPDYKDGINKIMRGVTWYALVLGWAFIIIISVLVLRVLFWFFT